MLSVKNPDYCPLCFCFSNYRFGKQRIRKFIELMVINSNNYYCTFYNVRSSIIASFFAAFIFAVFFFLYQTGLVRYDISDVSNSYIGINISLRYMIILLSGLMLAFGINHIQKQLLNSIDSLTDQKKHLKRVAKKLRKEIKIRKKSEALAIQNEKNFRNIFETSSDAILIINTERKIVDFNPAFLSLSKYPENQ